MCGKSDLVAVFFVVLTALFSSVNPAASESSNRVKLLDIRPVQSGPTERMYFYSSSDDADKLLAFRRELIARGCRNVNFFYPTVVVCEVPAGIAGLESGADPDILMLREAEVEFTAKNTVGKEMRRVKNCYQRYEQIRSASPIHPEVTPILETGPVSMPETPAAGAADRERMEPAESRSMLQNSEFLIGDILIQAIYPESMGNQENWTDASLSSASQGLQMAILSWQDNYRNIPINAIFNNYTRSYTALEPITFMEVDQAVWIKDVMRHLGYEDNTLSIKSLIHLFNNDGREQFKTDWVFTAFIANAQNDEDHNFERAGRQVGWNHLGGPYLVLPYPAGYDGPLILSTMFKHHMASIFWATHENVAGGNSCDTRSGYLYYANLNKTVSIHPVGGPVGCFDQPPDPCIMVEGYASSGWTDPPCRYTEGMLGIVDKNNNFVPDALDAPPTIQFSTARRETVWTADYELRFQAISEGVPNRNPYQPAETRIDYKLPVRDVSYEVNGVGPIILMPEDGKSDELVEDFVVRLPDMIPGLTEIGITSRNTLGSTSGKFVKQLYYMGLSYRHVTFNFSNQGIGISWNMLGELFGATFDLHRITPGPVPVDSIIVAGVPYTPIADYFTPMSCFDSGVIPGQKYVYYIEGSFDTVYRGSVRSVTIQSNHFEIIASLNIEKNLISSAPSPNPFRDQTWISINVPASYREAGDPNGAVVPGPGGRTPAQTVQDEIPTHVDVTIYNVLGRPVKRLYKDRIYSTVLTIHWDGTNDNHEKAPSGIYFMRIKTGPYQQVQKVMILR